MEVSCLSTAYRVRRLEEADVPQILRLCSGNPQFYQYTIHRLQQRTAYVRIYGRYHLERCRRTSFT